MELLISIKKTSYNFEDLKNNPQRKTKKSQMDVNI